MLLTGGDPPPILPQRVEFRKSQPSPPREMDPFTKLYGPVLLLLVLLVAGTTGYRLLYPIPMLDALYMTVITLATVGFREVYPLDEKGKIFTILLILTGLGGITFTASSVFQFMVAGHLTGMVKRRKMEKTLDSLRNHYIVCGFGRVGEQIAQDLTKAGARFVVIDSNPEALARVEKHGYLFVAGNATNDEVLQKAGIEHAKGLVAASDSDPDNVLITLSAKLLNPKLFIASRASSEDVFDKLYKLGANRVVSPYLSTGQKMAAMMLKPVVHDYLDTMAYSTDLEIRIGDMELPPDCEIVGKTIQDSAIRKRTGVTILAIKKPEGRVLTNPPVSTVLAKGDHLILVGTAQQLDALTQMILPGNREPPG